MQREEQAGSAAQKTLKVPHVGFFNYFELLNSEVAHAMTDEQLAVQWLVTKENRWHMAASLQRSSEGGAGGKDNAQSQSGINAMIAEEQHATYLNGFEDENGEVLDFEEAQQQFPEDDQPYPLFPEGTVLAVPPNVYNADGSVDMEAMQQVSTHYSLVH